MLADLCECLIKRHTLEINRNFQSIFNIFSKKTIPKVSANKWKNVNLNDTETETFDPFIYEPDNSKTDRPGLTKMDVLDAQMFILQEVLAGMSSPCKDEKSEICTKTDIASSRIMELADVLRQL
eukprot:GHVL01038392.1.p1 GENE.GHVL01038392.1~~GHVL01038392.1.p1  ORF type:complete len:124 (+),score=12.85 GHVL01038392.1:217-588(+)